jgi:hypothetical protein
MSRLAPSLPLLQLEELGARKRYTHPLRAEVDEYRGLVFDIENAAETVLVVRHQILPLIGLNGFLDDGHIKRTAGQVPPCGAGARWSHFPNRTRLARTLRMLGFSALATGAA